MGDLACDLRDLGHEVMILTTTPHYNRDREAEARQPLRGSWGPFIRKSTFHGIPVFHTMMPHKGSNVVFRLISWVGFHCLSTLAGLTAIPRPDIIIAPSPPLTIGVSAWLIGTLRGARFIYNVQEIYPDIAIRLRALRNHTAIRLLCRVEAFVYRKSSVVTVIAPRMRLNLLQKAVPDEKVKVIPNFVDLDDFLPLPKDNAFSRKYGVHTKFVVSYAGNFGIPQGLETFLDAARLLKDEPDIMFMMIGEGMQGETLRRRSAALGLENLQFIPHQPFSQVPQIYASSDANLVPQTAEAGFDAVPSKIYRIMACARPVIAVTDPSSDLANLITDAGCGIVVPPGSARDLAEAILKAHKSGEEWARLGTAGRTHVLGRFARKAVTGRYDRLIREILSSRSGPFRHD